MKRHNKKRNTAFLFETLIKEMAKSVVANDSERQTKIAKIIKRHFFPLLVLIVRNNLNLTFGQLFSNTVWSIVF